MESIHSDVRVNVVQTWMTSRSINDKAFKLTPFHSDQLYQFYT